MIPIIIKNLSKYKKEALPIKKCFLIGCRSALVEDLENINMVNTNE